MAWRSACILGLLLFTLPSWGDPSQDREMSAVEYRAQLDQLITKTAQPNLTSSEISDIKNELPSTWRVNVGSQEFDISTEWLRDDLAEALD